MAKFTYNFEAIERIQATGNRSSVQLVNKVTVEKDKEGKPVRTARDVIEISLGASHDLLKLDPKKPVKITLEQ